MGKLNITAKVKSVKVGAPLVKGIDDPPSLQITLESSLEDDTNASVLKKFLAGVDSVVDVTFEVKSPQRLSLFDASANFGEEQSNVEDEQEMSK